MTQGGSSTYADAGATETFTVSKNFGTCSLSDNAEIQGVDGSSEATYSCGGLVQKADGLHFLACGREGEIIVPGS